MSGGRPDFLIAGTMKGGTTVLYDDICMHPEVQQARQKEIHYFSLHLHRGVDWYGSYFDTTPGKITGEASPTYFDAAYTMSIPHSIRVFNPEMKVIVITRDPVERAVSHFYHLKNVNKVPELADMDVNEFFSSEFADCITVTDNRNYLLQQVLYFGAYARKAMFYRNVFDAENLLFVDNTGLRKAPKETMELVFGFLGLDPIYDERFELVKFSSGRTSSDLDAELKEKLTKFYEADYATFSRMTTRTALPGVG